MKRPDADVVLTAIDLHGAKMLSDETQHQDIGDVTVLHPDTYDTVFVKEVDELFEAEVGMSDLNIARKEIREVDKGSCPSWPRWAGSAPTASTGAGGPDPYRFAYVCIRRGKFVLEGDKFKPFYR